jgi:hypothetical protein
MTEGRTPEIGGWAVWAGALALAFLLPGSLWKAQPPPPFPWAALGPTVLTLGVLVVTALSLAALLGPRLARWRGLALLEAPPDLLWGGLVLALWPAPWGPPGAGAWAFALLASALPGELRWLAATLPAESPFPAAWGIAATQRARRRGLRTLLPAWLGARLPLWLTGALVLERIFGFQGLGSDWMARVAVRDRLGLALWILGLALLWRVARPGKALP